MRLNELKKAAETHRLQELERKYAVRYHKVCSRYAVRK